jgi:hypothetical protein
MSGISHGVADTMDKIHRKTREKLAIQLLFLSIFTTLSKIMWLLTLESNIENKSRCSLTMENTLFRSTSVKLKHICDQFRIIFCPG